MKDPQAPLWKAIVAAVRADAATGAIIGMGTAARFYDRTPKAPTFPLVTGEGMQSVPDYDGCGFLVEVFVRIDCWSTAVGYEEVRNLANALVGCLDAKLTVTGWTVVMHEVRPFDTRRERDNLTSRAPLTIRYVLRPAA